MPPVHPRRPHRAAVTIAAFALTLVAVACNDDGGSSSSRARGEPDRERHCALANELEDGSAEVFGAADSAAEFDDAYADFVDRYGEQLDEQLVVAPDEISDQVQLRVDAIRAVAEGDDVSEDKEEDVAQANAEIDAFERRSC